MEIIVAVAVFGFGLWWVFLRTPADTKPSAPYKIETPPAPEPAPVVVETAPAVVTDTVVVVENAVVPEAVVAEAPAKKPRTPRAPKVEAPVAKPAAKKAAPVKKAAAIKAAPKKPATPRSKKA
jgi:hypothetical protein